MQLMYNAVILSFNRVPSIISFYTTRFITGLPLLVLMLLILLLLPLHATFTNTTFINFTAVLLIVLFSYSLPECSCGV